MSDTFSYGRRGDADGGHRHCATERRRHRRGRPSSSSSSSSSFSIMKWFRRTDKRDDDHDDPSWFRDDLQRIKQACAAQEPDYAAVTPIAARRRRRRTTATWSRWSGSTTTVYSFAYVDGGDAVPEYVDAATLPAAGRRSDRGQCRTGTRRRNKRVAPPPPPPPLPPPPSVEVKATRKKYKAPQPPVTAVMTTESRPQQHNVAVGRRVPPRRRRNKGPAPKPPVQQQQQRRETNSPTIEPDGDGRRGSNVRRKITQYERDRLLQRVDKIEKHFFERRTETAAEKRTGENGQGAKPDAAGSRHGFASASALYTAMAVTNLTELDKRAAEICRRKRLETAAVTGPQRRPAAITSDHKNAIVAAVIRKSYPSVTAQGDKRPVWPPSAAAEGSFFSGKSSAAAVAATDEKQLVRHKRLAFFEQRANTSSTCATDVRSTAVAAATAAAAEDDDAGAAAVVVVGRGGERSSESKNLPSEDSNCYEQLMAMEMQSDLVLHNGPFECAVCLCTYDNNGVVLRDCLHVFCRPCLQMTISHSNAERVECPYIDERYSCPGVLQHREIKKILDSDEEYERFLERSVERARQLLAKDRNGGSFQCARPDCTGWCLIYDKRNVFEFKCPVCQAVTCVRCGSIHEPGKGCRRTSDGNDGGGGGGDGTPETLEDLIDRGDAMPCPGCNTVLSKQQGCDWIKCAVCCTEICWATKGPRWGPKGKGDTTAGCMCGIPVGRKCHVDCKYCH